MKLKEVMTPGRGSDRTRGDPPARPPRKCAACISSPLPVCDGDQLVGMLTDRDITVRAVAEGCDPTTHDGPRGHDPGHGRTASTIKPSRTPSRRWSSTRFAACRFSTATKRLVGMVSLGDLAVSSGDQTAGRRDPQAGLRASRTPAVTWGGRTPARWCARAALPHHE